MMGLMRAHRGSGGAVAAMLAIAAQRSACGTRGSAIDPTGSRPSRPDSGIRGHVLRGPTCPVQRGGKTCVRPFQATITIRSEATGRLVARARSLANGRFGVALPSGTYVLVPRPGRPYPRSSPQTSTVHAHRYTSVVISYDSGIR
jgi:hypothetical protein